MRAGALSNKKSRRRGSRGGVDSTGGLGYHARMIETFFFLFGLGFSFLVYFRSIRKTDYSWPKKAIYFFFTLIGITGTLFLFGVLVADKIRALRGC